MIEELVNAGLNGIEAVYSCNQGSDEKDFREMAEKYQLLLSGGSDFHGANKPYIHLGTGKGNMAVPYEFLEAMKKFLIILNSEGAKFIFVFPANNFSSSFYIVKAPNLFSLPG